MARSQTRKNLHDEITSATRPSPCHCSPVLTKQNKSEFTLLRVRTNGLCYAKFPGINASSRRRSMNRPGHSGIENSRALCVDARTAPATCVPSVNLRGFWELLTIDGVGCHLR